MKKIGLLFREISENHIKDRLKESETVFVLNYSKLSSADLSNLRRSLKETNAALFVVKNTIARRALKGSRLDELSKFIEGPCGLVFIKDEPLGPSRVLYDFSRGHEALELRGGILKDKLLEKKDIETLARLPSREVLRAQAVIALKAPISGLVITLKQLLRKFVYCLEQISEKKSNEGTT